MNIFQINKREDFTLLINGMSLTGVGIEIGVATANFSSVLINSGLSKIFLLDAWTEFKDGYIDINNVPQKVQDNRYAAVLQKMIPYKNRVRVIRKTADDAVKDIDDNFFDFIYLDANHKYDEVMSDLIKWFPKVKSGGVFAGHDYLNGTIHKTEFGVKTAVDEFIIKTNVHLYVTTMDKEWDGVRYPSWYFKK